MKINKGNWTKFIVISILCIDSCNAIAKATFNLQSSLVFLKGRKLQLLLPPSLTLYTNSAKSCYSESVFKCIYTEFGLESEVSFYPVIESLEKQLRNRSSSA